MKSPLNSTNTYLVGGAVRDRLLGIDATDSDYVVIGCLPEQLVSQGFTQVGKDFPVFLHPETKDEYALARTERKSGSGYGGFVCDFHPDITIEQDLLRRDLTINAMAQSLDGELIDPCGGRDDLHKRILRHVSPAFVEDPLRVLRVARFAARFAHLGFTVHPETMALMRQLSDSGELLALTAERAWREISRALEETTPSVFIQVLRDCGALAVLLPEVAALFGVPQTEKYHPEIDTGVHTLMCIDVAREHFNQGAITYAVLLHDLGKGVTPAELWPRHHNHEATGVPIVERVSKRFKVPKEHAALAKLVCLNHLRCHRVPEMKPTTILKLLQSLDGFRRPGRVEQFVAACESDSRGRLGFTDQDYPQGRLLLGCLSAAKQVTAAPFLAQGHQGKALAEQIARAQARAIGSFLQQNLP